VHYIYSFISANDDEFFVAILILYKYIKFNAYIQLLLAAACHEMNPILLMDVLRSGKRY
jgi:hypothetical protein